MPRVFAIEVAGLPEQVTDVEVCNVLKKSIKHITSSWIIKKMISKEDLYLLLSLDIKRVTEQPSN